MLAQAICVVYSLKCQLGAVIDNILSSIPSRPTQKLLPRHCCMLLSQIHFGLMWMSRAKYITGTVKALQLKHGGGAEWLMSLRKLDLEEVIDALSSLPGVGPKVAACIALFSLDQHHAIPVDTHVWKVRFYS